MADFEVRRITDDDDGDWYDIEETWGMQVLNDSDDVLKRGAVQYYSYQFVNSNERRHITIKDDDGKVVRECTTLTLSVMSYENICPSGYDDVLEAFNSFVDFLSEDAFELRSKVSYISNKYTIEGDINPSPTIDSTGKITHITCGIEMMQLIAK